jgi:putative oxidoreductase
MTTNRLLSTSDDWTLTALRATLGIVILAHGAQKMLGWFGGFGFEGTMNFFTNQMGIPALFAFLAIAAEFFGGLGLIVGLLTRVAALGVASVMAVAVAMVHTQFGFFMNWNGNQKGEGFEYHVLVLAITVVLMVRGAGAWSLDRIISGRAASANSHGHLPVHA